MAAEILKTSTDEGHWHAALLREADGFTTKGADGHVHQLVYYEGAEEQRDPITLKVVTPALAPGWYVQPAEDGHTHEVLMEPLGKEQTPDAEAEDPTETLKDFYADFDACVETDRKSMENGREGKEYYKGNQWDENHKKLMNDSKRAVVTINEVESKIDALTGYQRQNRSDIKFLPMENGDNTVSDVLNIYMKRCFENMNYHREESKVFLDETVEGRGAFHIFVDFENNIEGDIVVERYRNVNCFIGPHEKEDLSDCDVLCLQQFIAEGKLVRMYPDVDPNILRSRPTFEEAQKLPRSEDWDGKRISEQQQNMPKRLAPVEVLERWKKEYFRVDVVAFVDEGIYIGLQGLSKAERAKLQEFEGALVIPRTLFRMRQTIVAGGEILNPDDQYPGVTGLALNEFSIVPVYAKFLDGEWWGKVKGIRDLQLLTNKGFSLFVDLCAKMASSGWFHDHDTFASQDDKREFDRKVGGPGFNLKIKNINKPPARVEGGKVPGELVQLLMMVKTNIREILNINLEQLGLDSSSQSGVALRQKIAQQLLGNDYLFDSLAQAKKQIGKKWVKLVQLTQNPDRILRVLGEAASKEPVEISGQSYVTGEQPPMPVLQGQTPPQPLQPMMGTLRDKLQKELFDNPELLTQDVVVSESPASPSAMIGGYMALIEAAQAGVPVTPDMILSFAPIPNKAKLLQSLQAQQAAMAQQEDKKYQTEIMKTQIAHQPKPGGQAA